MRCLKQIVQIDLSIRGLERISVCAPSSPSTVKRKNTRGTKCVRAGGSTNWKLSFAHRVYQQGPITIKHDTHTRRTSIAIISRTCSHFPPQSTPTHFVGCNQGHSGDSYATQWCTSVVWGAVVSASAVPERCPSGLWNNSSGLLFSFSLFESSGTMRELQSPHNVLAVIFLCQALLGRVFSADKRFCFSFVQTFAISASDCNLAPFNCFYFPSRSCILTCLHAPLCFLVFIHGTVFCCFRSIAVTCSLLQLISALL